VRIEAGGTSVAAVPALAVPVVAGVAAGPAWGIAAAVITATFGLLGHLLVRARQAQDRRRDEYSRAFAAAMQWREFPYRVARRLSNEPGEVTPIVQAFHDAQVDIEFHRTWLRSASPELADAYGSLVDNVKAAARPHIEAAWRRPPAKVPEGMILGAEYEMDISTAESAFLDSVKRDLRLRTTFRG
jgi:hypothetical protein